MSHPTHFCLKPAGRLQVPDPDIGDYLPREGRLCPRNAYWLRRVKDGDVSVDISAGEMTSPAPPQNGSRGLAPLPGHGAGKAPESNPAKKSKGA